MDIKLTEYELDEVAAMIAIQKQLDEAIAIEQLAIEEDNL